MIAGGKRQDIALLFDMGGVVIDIDFKLALGFWSKHSSLPQDELLQRFSMGQEYDAHERGEIDWPTYARHLQQQLLLPDDNEIVLQGWNSIFKGPINPVVEAISSIHPDVHCSILTNSNPTHQACWEQQFKGPLSMFEHIFVSSEMACRKPEPRCFQHVAAQMGFALEQIMFFDDLAENVTGARETGMQATLVRSSTDVLDALQRLELI